VGREACRSERAGIGKNTLIIENIKLREGLDRSQYGKKSFESGTEKKTMK
jgi:hypothetical protein